MTLNMCGFLPVAIPSRHLHLHIGHFCSFQSKISVKNKISVNV